MAIRREETVDIAIHEKIRTVNVWWESLKSYIPVYLARGRLRALVDAGPPQRKPGILAAALEPFGLTPADIDLVLLTHGHMDHIGGLSELKAAGPVEIAMGADDAHFISNHEKVFNDFYSIGEKMLSENRDISEFKKRYLMDAGPEYTADRLLNDGDEIDLGNNLVLTALNLPGHSKGSIGYYWEKEGVIICGDAIPALGGPDGSLPIIMDLFAYLNSIDRLMALPIDKIVFAHSYRGLKLAPATVRQGAEIKEYLADAKLTAEKLVESLEKAAVTMEGKSFREVADQVIAAMPAKMGFIPLDTQFMPQLSVSTIYWGVAAVKEKRVA
jgi:glyoxylase-like metal-dependent hydrolase (beta-lactamase superfamily II)